MSGPIVRSGPSPEYSSNWAEVFGGKKSAAKPAQKTAAKKPAAKKAAKKKTNK